MQGIAEAPLLPVHFAVFNLEAWSVRLGDDQRSERRRTRSRAQFGILARDGDVAIDIEKVDHLAGGEIDVRHHAFDGMRVQIGARAGIIRHHGHHASGVGAGLPVIAGAPCHGEDVFGVADAALAHGLRPARVGAHNFIRQIGILGVDGWLRSRDQLPGIDGAGREVGNRLPGLVGFAVVDHGKRAPWNGRLRQHHCLGWFIERDEAEACAGGKTVRASQQLRGRADFVGGERCEGMRSGGKTRHARQANHEESASHGITRSHRTAVLTKEPGRGVGIDGPSKQVV